MESLTVSDRQQHTWQWTRSSMLMGMKYMTGVKVETLTSKVQRVRERLEETARMSERVRTASETD